MHFCQTTHPITKFGTLTIFIKSVPAVAKKQKRRYSIGFAKEMAMNIDVKKLQSLLDDAVSSGLECGCQLAIYYKGELVADLCAGYTAPDQKTPVKPDSLFPVFSVGKAMFSAAIHRLVEKGTLSYSTRIADVWPEYGCNGKENTLLWHVMSHRSAMSQMPDVPLDEVADWDLMCERIAQMAPAWKPGTKCSYQPYSFAWLLGEPAVRADGRPLQQILRDEIIRPLDLENEMFFGISDEAMSRFVPLDSSGSYNDCVEKSNHPALQKACIPSFNGIMSARAIAKFYTALDAEMGGVQLLKPETVENAAIPRRAADDPLDPAYIWPRFGLGFVTGGTDGIYAGIMGHGGAVGAEGLIDRKNHLALGFTRNRIDPRHPNHPLRDLISEELNLPIRHW